MLSSFGGGSIQGLISGGSSYPTVETYGLNSSFTYSGWGGTDSPYTFDTPLSSEYVNLLNINASNRTTANLVVDTFGERAISSDYLEEFSILGSGDASTNLQHNGRFVTNKDGVNYYRLAYDTHNNYIYQGDWNIFGPPYAPDVRISFSSFPSSGSQVSLGSFAAFGSTFLYGSGGDILFQSGHDGHFISAGRGSSQAWQESSPTGSATATGTFAASMGYLLGAGYSPDDETVIVTADRTDTAKVWRNWRTGSPTLLASLTPPLVNGSSVAIESTMFTKYGDVLISGLQDGTPLIWLFKRTA